MPTLDRLTAALADRYRIERELGAGGMATVYLAEDLKHDRRVAIKVLKPELAAVLGAERFVVEIKTTAAMSHPHILPLFDSGEADGFLYYVMPYIEGETIREKLTRETQFGIDEAVCITREIADALDYAHRRGIIHRDIKPENILLHDGRAMVMDFGIALAVSAAAGGRMTETGLSLGTPHYMSPEQATAEKEITPRSDVYSLASVLYEMLAGQPPHLGGSAQAIIMKIIAEPAQLVTQLRKSVPTNVAAALDMALQKVPADRFESAAKFAEALANPTFTTRGTAQLTGAMGSTRGVPTPWFLAAAAVALIATAAAGWGLLRPAPVPRVTRFPLLLPEDQALSGGVSGATLATLTPDGRTLVYVAGEGRARRLWVRPLDRLNATPLAGTENAVHPSVSPDGTRIAFTATTFLATTSPRALKVVPISGGPVLTLTDYLVDNGSVSWGTDGYIYYDGHLEGDGIARIKETGGRPEIASRPDTSRGEVYHNMPSALPGGRGILLVSRTTTAKRTRREIAVLDTRTGTHRILTDGVSALYAESGHLLFVTAEGNLMAAPFDLGALRLSGEAVLVGDGVAVGSTIGATISASRDGTLAYVAGSSQNAKRELVWVGRDGIARAVDSSWSGEMTGRPVISPDGRTAAVAMAGGSEQQIWVKQLDRGPAMRVADLGTAPSWSPDGRSLLFTTPGDGPLQTVPADGSVLPSGIPGRGGSPQFSSDGQWVIYVRGGDIFGQRTSGDTAEVTLVQDPGSQAVPMLSPDGRWLAYASSEIGTLQVYVRPFPDTKVAKRQLSTAPAYAPRWSRSRRELFYFQRDDAGSPWLWSVDVVPASAFTTGTPKRLFSVVPYDPIGTHNFDVSADGQRFLFTRAVGSGAGAAMQDRIVIVQNFAAELRAKVR